MKRLYVIAFIFCLIMIIWQIASRRNENSILMKSGTLTTAQIIAFGDVGKYGEGVSYTFTVDNKKYTQKLERTELDYKHFELFLGKTFPVIYDSQNPSTNRILITKSDFKRFKISIPDTLKGLIDKTE